MEIHSTHILATLVPTAGPARGDGPAGDEIAELSAHLEAATARLLDLTVSSTPAAAGVTGSAPAPTG